MGRSGQVGMPVTYLVLVELISVNVLRVSGYLKKLFANVFFPVSYKYFSMIYIYIYIYIYRVRFIFYLSCEKAVK